MASVFLGSPIVLQVGKPSQAVPVTLVDQTDVITLEAGVSTPTIQISKNGAAYGSASDGTFAEVGNGDYTVTLDATDTNTLGWLMLRVVKSGVSAETKVMCEVSIDSAEKVSMAERIRTFRRQEIGS
jgi:hypothetical protein